jgi:membrane fusion protein, heavy metal efflux system
MNPSSNPAAPLPRIPVPPGQRWREFRIRVMPFATFLAALTGVIFIWRENVAAPMLQGEAESRRALVASPQPGTISELKVVRFQRVSRGEPLGTVLPTDPRMSLSLLQSEIDILRARLEPGFAQQRNATDYERLRLEWLLQKANLASARVALARAENELKRDEALFQQKLISADLYDSSNKTMEQLAVEVAEKTKLLADMELQLQGLKGLGDPTTSSALSDATIAALKSPENKLKLAENQIGPITLTAPVDGVVSFVNRREGENVMDGEPILTITTQESERIVGYLRQPFTIEPEVGMSVEVRTRAQRSTSRLSQITRIGSQLEPITNSLALIRPGAIVDMGLPLEIGIPADLKIRPGELVDLIIRPQQP